MESKGTVVSTEQIRNNVISVLEDNSIRLTPKEIETVIDTYMRYYVLRVDPAAIKMICEEVIK